MPKLLQNLHAIDIRQDDIQNHSGVRIPPRHLDRLPAIGNADNLHVRTDQGVVDLFGPEMIVLNDNAFQHP